MNDCACGHPEDEHVGGACLWTLDCLCRGYEDVGAFLDRLSDALRSNDEVIAIVPWGHERRSQS